MINKERLHSDLNCLEELKDFRSFLSSDDDYTIKVKRERHSYIFNECEVFNKSLTIKKKFYQ